MKYAPTGDGAVEVARTEVDGIDLVELGPDLSPFVI